MLTETKSQAAKVAVTITRPANQTAYTAGDVLGAAAAAITFAGLGPPNTAKGWTGAIKINSTELEADIASVPAGMTNFLLHLYSVTPPSALADNAAFDLPSGDRASYLGSIDLGTPVDLGSTLYKRQNAVGAQFLLAGTSVFGYLQTVGGFTPAANSEVYKVTLHAEWL